MQEQADVRVLPECFKSEVSPVCCSETQISFWPTDVYISLKAREEEKWEDRWRGEGREGGVEQIQRGDGRGKGDGCGKKSEVGGLWGKGEAR